jgi:hypothetical protein
MPRRRLTGESTDETGGIIQPEILEAAPLAHIACPGTLTFFPWPNLTRYVF